MNIDVKWGKGPTFAEVAEALGVPTDQIVGMAQTGTRYTVLYSPDPYVEGNEPEIYRQSLDRDADGVLVKFGGATHMPGYWVRAFLRIERKMEDLHGDD